MASLADYIVLSDGPFEIDSNPGGAPSTRILEFNLPSNFIVGTNRARPILSYVHNFISNNGSVGVWINPQFPLLQSQRDHLLTWNNPPHMDVGLWEAIQGTRFQAGQENRIVFAMQEANSGRVRFRDVVLWIQRDE